MKPTDTGGRHRHGEQHMRNQGHSKEHGTLGNWLVHIRQLEKGGMEVNGLVYQAGESGLIQWAERKGGKARVLSRRVRSWF